ncbi:MAG: tandem-95 repeat protein [Candidatus Accumulibacter sp.]|uniref:Tandem-95 repeat protein n=1 Tax=Candidatus Accumulibacter affinis TaxID=2954384 RepID=A0A935T7D8_9PROT|nr:tandem-95 repeat protein [Candidatus Accumulibacter affinis]
MQFFPADGSKLTGWVNQTNQQKPVEAMGVSWVYDLMTASQDANKTADGTARPALWFAGTNLLGNRLNLGINTDYVSKQNQRQVNGKDVILGVIPDVAPDAMPNKEAYNNRIWDYENAPNIAGRLLNPNLSNYNPTSKTFGNNPSNGTTQDPQANRQNEVMLDFLAIFSVTQTDGSWGNILIENGDSITVRRALFGNGSEADGLVDGRNVLIGGTSVTIGSETTADSLRRLMGDRRTADYYANWLPPLRQAMLEFDMVTPQRIISFLAQVNQESGGMTNLSESFNYSQDGLANTFSYLSTHYGTGATGSPKTLAQLWGRQAGESRVPQARQELIANTVYSSEANSQLGNGNILSGDGWLFRGRGLKQITGRANYQAFANYLDSHPISGQPAGAEVMQDPGPVSSNDYLATRSAGWFWRFRSSRGNLNSLADNLDMSKSETEKTQFNRISAGIGNKDHDARWSNYKANVDLALTGGNPHEQLRQALAHLGIQSSAQASYESKFGITLRQPSLVKIPKSLNIEMGNYSMPASTNTPSPSPFHSLVGSLINEGTLNILALEPGESNMFVLEPPHPAVQVQSVLLAQAHTSRPTMVNQAHEMGVCRVVPNVPFKYVQTASGSYPEQEPILPYSDVSFYFREYEHQEINHWYGSAGPFDESNVKVVRRPEHGVLVEAKCEEHHAYCTHQAYYYRPEVGYFGQDSAIIDADVNGFSVRVRYYFHSMDTAAFQKAEVCDATGLDWKIAQSRAGSDNATNVGWRHSEIRFRLIGAISRLTVGYRDFIGAIVAQTTGTGPAATITLSPDAAGHGWFVDSTPWLNEEFLPTSSPTEWIAKPGSEAEGRMDLLTVLLHEYGHTLGLDHSLDPHDNMAATLPPGVRRTLSAEQQLTLLRLAGVFPAPESPSEPYAPTDPGAPIPFTRVNGLARSARLRSADGSPDSRSGVPQYDIAANTRLENPAFTNGTGWSTSGDVRFADGSATLVESPDHQTRLNQVFVLGENDRFLSFTVDDLTLGDPSAGGESDQADGPDDAFEVALLDANTGRSLLGGNGLTHSDAFLNRQEDGSEYRSDGIRVLSNADGSRSYRIDLAAASSPVAAGSVLNLSFDLIGFGKGSQARDSRVTIRDLHLGDEPQLPQLIDDTASTLEDTPLQIDALANDLNADLPGFAPLLVDAPEHGQVQVNADGSFTFTPESNWHGDDRFSYLLADGVARTDVATVRVLVTPVADAPMLRIQNGDGATREVFRTSWESVGNPNRSATVVWQNQLEGWRLVSEANPATPFSNRFVVWSNGDHLAVPAGSGSVSYQAAAGNGSNWLELTNAPRNQPGLLGIERSVNTIAGARYLLSLDVASPPNYSADYIRIAISVDGQTIGSDASSSPASGLAWQTRTFEFLGSGGRQTIRIAPAATRFEVSSRGMMIDDLTLTELLPANTGYEDTAIALSAIDAALRDADGSETLAVQVTEIPAGATLSDGQHRFTATADERTADVSDWHLATLSVTPPPDYHGHITLRIVATATEHQNQAQASTTANVEVQALPVNDAPLARNASIMLDEGGSTIIDLAPLISDIDGDRLTLSLADPGHGALSRNTDGTWTYHPNRHYSGQDSFRYTVSDGQLSATATITLTVTPVNHPPRWTSTPPARCELRPATADTIFQVASTASGIGTVTLDPTFSNAVFNDEIGLYRVDDASGRIGQIKPGDPGYAAAALAEDRVLAFFRTAAGQSSQRMAQLPAGQYLGFYLVENGSATQWRNNQPGNGSGQGRRAFFSVPAANADHLAHLHASWTSDGSLRIAGVASGPGCSGAFRGVIIEASGLTAPPLPFIYQARARDDDGDPLTYRLLEGPAGARIDAASGLLTWDQPQAGNQLFRLQVDDGRGGRVEQRFTVNFASPRKPCASATARPLSMAVSAAGAAISARARQGSGIALPASQPHALPPRIEWNGRQPACFSGAPIQQSSWLSDFLGASKHEGRPDWAALQIRLDP